MRSDVPQILTQSARDAAASDDRQYGDDCHNPTETGKEMWHGKRHIRRGSGGNVGKLMNAPDMDLVLALAGLRDVVGGLHSQERVHLHSKGFFNAQRHVSGKAGLAVEQARQGRPGNLKRRCRRCYRQARGLDNLRPNEISRMGRAGWRRLRSLESAISRRDQGGGRGISSQPSAKRAFGRSQTLKNNVCASPRKRRGLAAASAPRSALACS